MHSIQIYLEKIPGFAEFVRAVGQNPASQGVFVDLNPIWLRAYHLSRSGLGIPPNFDPFEFQYWWNAADEISPHHPEIDEPIDLNWDVPNGWVRHLTQRMGRHRRIGEDTIQFMVKVIAKPNTAELASARRGLLELALSQPFFTVVETRSLGELAVGSGDSCNVGSNHATIGGFLKDSITGQVYASTCGHVVAQGIQVSDVSGKSIGNCSFSHAPTTMTYGQFCARGSACANKLDFALVDVGNATVTNSVKSVASVISPRQHIELRRNGSLQSYEVGGIGVYVPGNSNVCFENVFEVRPRSRGGVLPFWFTNALAKIPVKGDSGAWIETSSYNEWCGVLVAVDKSMGYALLADEVLSEANSEFKTQLTLA